MELTLVCSHVQDILPFDRSRVVLPTIDGVEGSDFINANYLRNPKGECRVIAAQVVSPSFLMFDVGAVGCVCWCIYRH